MLKLSDFGFWGFQTLILEIEFWILGFGEWLWMLPLVCDYFMLAKEVDATLN